MSEERDEYDRPVEPAERMQRVMLDLFDRMDGAGTRVIENRLLPILRDDEKPKANFVTRWINRQA